MSDDCWENFKQKFNISRSEDGDTTRERQSNRRSGGDSVATDYLKGIGSNLNITKLTSWTRRDQPDVEIIDIDQIPEDWDISSEVLADDECYRITLTIIRATNLIAMDTNGMSDPFVEIIFGRNIHLKTKTINKNCNPVWNEKFTLYIDDRSALANLHVFDYDFLGSNDRIGYLDLDLASIPPFQRLTVTQNLGSSVEGEDNVGNLTYSYLVEIVKTSNAHDIKSIGTKGQEKLLGIIQVTVIEGIDLPPMNSDGSCDPFIRISLGSQQYETRTIPSTLNPKWRENFEFRYLSTSGDVLQVSLWDQEPGLSDNIIGDTEIDLSKIAANKPFKYIFGLDHTNTKVSLLIKVLKFAELGAAELQLQKEINEAESRILKQQFSIQQTLHDMGNVGYLIVKLIRATNIPNKGLGSVDPFVVIEIENCRSITPVRDDNLEPEWNLTYRYPIHDYHSVLYLSLWDEEDLVSNVLLGRIAIPLFNCHGLKRYILKDAKLEAVGKGELVVETATFYNPLRAAIRTFTPKEEIIMKEPSKFDITLLQRDVKRITAQVEMLQDAGEGLDNIIRWRSKPTSLISMILFVVVVYFFEIWMAPLALGIVLAWSLLYRKYGRGEWESYRMKVANKPYYLRTGRGEGESDLDESKMSITQRFEYMYNLAQTGQFTLNMVASIAEKLKNVFQWKNPFATGLLAILMVLASVLLYFVPIRYIILAWGINKFRKFGFDPNLIDNFELEDFLSRVPSDPELEELKEPTRRMKQAQDRRFM